MKAICYRKIYPFDKTVFKEKFINRTVPFHERIGSLKPLGRKLEGRVFIGKIKGEQFKILTFPDMYHLNIWPGIRKIPVWRNPSCIYGSIQELDGQTIVNCIIDLSTPHKIYFYKSIVIDCLAIMFVILVMLVEGFQPGVLIVIGICVLNAISSTSALQPHQSENEALIKFMEDLEN